MKSLVALLSTLLLESGSKCGAPVQRDLATLRARVKAEGDSFITITLPAFAADFERSLAAEKVAPGSFANFSKRRDGLPAFLSGFLCQVFDKHGQLLEEPSMDCILAVRQLCLFCKKVERPCSDARSKHAVERYIQCDDDIVQLPEGQLKRYYGYVARILLADAKLDLEAFYALMKPAHGPGATEEHILGNQKWAIRRWHARLLDGGIGMSHAGWSLSRMRDWDESMPEIVEPEAEKPVRVTLVQKTLKTPRVIAVEPVCMQYAQQGLARLLVRKLETSGLTRGHVNFRDQTVNQQLAIDGSFLGKKATLDLSDASDRVSKEHVDLLLESVPDFRRAVMACRSTRASLPDGREVTLKKFASMGSALTFPVEALVFYTIIIAHRIMSGGLFPTRQTVHTMSRDVYVYGDDLIVPSDEAPAIADALETFGLKVNRGKSFWTGKFRESCGMDAFRGVGITPVYLRRDVPSSRSDANGIVSAVSTANQLFEAGYARTAASIRKEVERLVGPLPQVRPDSPAVGWHCLSETMPKRRYNYHLQRWEEFHLLAKVPSTPDPLEGLGALLKCLRLVGSRDPIDPKHLERSPRRRGLTLNRGWVAATTSC